MFQEKIQVAQLNTSVPNSSLETFARLTGSSRVTGAGWAPARGGSRICGRTLAETTFGRTEYDNWSCPRDLEVLLRGATVQLQEQRQQREEYGETGQAARALRASASQRQT